MEIKIKIENNHKPNLSYYRKINQTICNNIDTISFASLKKSKFKGFNLAVINRFKAPIEKFNSQEDFEYWCKLNIDKIIKKDYEARKDYIKNQRKEIIEDWVNAISNKYPYAVQLLILSDITKDLKSDNDKCPAVLNLEALEMCINNIEKKLKTNPEELINFKNEYEKEIKKIYILTLKNTGSAKNGEYTGWLVIPSYKNDKKNFSKNTDKVKMFSCKTWCTSSSKAKDYLKQGDFHVYFEKGKPKIAIRLKNNTIIEIQGEKNSFRIPFKYTDIIEQYIANNKNFTVSRELITAINNSKIANKKIESLNQKLSALGKDLKTCTSEELFSALGIKTKKTNENKLILEQYSAPSKYFSFYEIGIDEDKLLKDVVKIEGDADFRNSFATNLGGIKEICGNVLLANSKIKTLGSLEKIGKSIYFENSEVISLGNLKYIEGNADFTDSKIETLENLEYVGDSLYAEKSSIKDLKNLVYVGQNAYCRKSPLESLGKLKYIGNNCDLSKTKIKTLENLEYIGNNADFSFTNVISTGNLKFIGGKVKALFTPIRKELLKLSNRTNI